MAILFVPVSFILILLMRLKRGATSWLEGALQAAVLWGLGVVGLTEGLSLAGLLLPGPAAAAWALWCAGLAWALREVPERPRRAGRPDVALPAWGWLGLLVLAGLTLATALLFAPNNIDSMFYHLARIEHWRQAGSLRHYPTNYLLQLGYPPFTEYCLLHFHLLSGGDRFDNLLQWFSFAGAAGAGVLFLEQAGAGNLAKGLSLAFALTHPMGLLQASSTQNDLVAGLWLCLLGVWVLQPPSSQRIFFGGATAGLAILTKGTDYLYVLAPLTWMAFSEWRDLGKKAWPRIVIAGILAILPNLGHWSRNVADFGSAWGPGEEHFSEDLSLGAAACSGAKNLSVHLSATPWDSFDGLVLRSARQACSLLGKDANDPATNWKRTWFGIYGAKASWRHHEDYAASLPHFLILLLALGWTLGGGRKVRLLQAFSLCGGLLYVWLIRFNPWACRLHLPLILLAAPAAGMFLESLAWLPRSLVLGLLLVQGGHFALFNVGRPLLHCERIFSLPRQAQYFIYDPLDYQPLKFMGELCARRGYSRVGLRNGTLYFEYSQWQALHMGAPGLELRQVMVPNLSAKWESGVEWTPQAILAHQERVPLPRHLHYGGKTFTRLAWAGNFVLFESQEWPQGALP